MILLMNGKNMRHTNYFAVHIATMRKTAARKLISKGCY